MDEYLSVTMPSPDAQELVALSATTQPYIQLCFSLSDEELAAVTNPDNFSLVSELFKRICEIWDERSGAVMDSSEIYTRAKEAIKYLKEAMQGGFTRAELDQTKALMDRLGDWGFELE